MEKIAAPLTRVSARRARPRLISAMDPTGKSPQQPPPRLWIGFTLLALWLAVIAAAAWAIWFAPAG